MNELTDRQKEVYTFIKDYIETHGFSPSFREIGKALYITHKGVSYHIQRLVSKGVVDYVPNIPRSISIKK